MALFGAQPSQVPAVQWPQNTGRALGGSVTQIQLSCVLREGPGRRLPDRAVDAKGVHSDPIAVVCLFSLSGQKSLTEINGRQGGERFTFPK